MRQETRLIRHQNTANTIVHVCDRIEAALAAPRPAKVEATRGDVMIGGPICRYMFTWSKTPDQYAAICFWTTQHESRALFEPQVQFKISPSHWAWLGTMSGFLLFFWLVILTSSKVHLHYKFAILTRSSSLAHLFIRVILKSCLLFSLPPRRGWPWSLK